MTTKTNIIVRFQIEGFHNWPAAKKLLPKVAFLSDRHRHVFYVECKKAVSHSDRDVEIILFKREVTQYLFKKYAKAGAPHVCEFGAMSCEMIAEELLKKFQLEYCSVLEDNENGAECFTEQIVYSRTLRTNI